ncbi:hypothetical protein FF1_041185 [Malus domestica]
MMLSEYLKSGSTTLTPRKGMSCLFSFSHVKNHSSYTPSSTSTGPKPSPTLSLSMMEENIETAEFIITKWDPNSSSYTKLTSIFQSSRKEAKQLLKSVKDLRSAMHVLVHESSPSSKLVLAQNLMQTAMKRLEREFYEILSANRRHLDPESVSSRTSIDDQ